VPGCVCLQGAVGPRPHPELEAAGGRRVSSRRAGAGAGGGPRRASRRGLDSVGGREAGVRAAFRAERSHPKQARPFSVVRDVLGAVAGVEPFSDPAI